MRKVPRVERTCPVCKKDFSLTEYQINLSRKQPPACSRLCARMVPVWDHLRSDAPGPFLLELTRKHGGMDRFARKLEIHRRSLFLLITIQGRIPRTKTLRVLSRISRQSITQIHKLFGIRVDERTKRVIDFVRSRFPRDSLRLRIVAEVEEHGSIRAYTRWLKVKTEYLRRWLLGQSSFLNESTLRMIARRHHLTTRDVGLPKKTAENYKLDAFQRKVQKRWRKGMHHSAHMRLALSSTRKTMLYRKLRRRLIKQLKRGHEEVFFHNEEKYLRLLVNQRIAHAEHFRGPLRQRAVSDRASAVLILTSEVWDTFKDRFPQSRTSLARVGELISERLKLPWRHRDFGLLVRFIESIFQTPRSERLWPTVAQHVYGSERFGHQATVQWGRFEKDYTENALRRLAEAHVGRRLERSEFETLTKARRGRPRKQSPLAPVNN
jgi:hypothetical protein